MKASLPLQLQCSDQRKTFSLETCLVWKSLITYNTTETCLVWTSLHIIQLTETCVVITSLHTYNTYIHTNTIDRSRQITNMSAGQEDQELSGVLSRKSNITQRPGGWEGGNCWHQHFCYHYCQALNTQSSLKTLIYHDR